MVGAKLEELRKRKGLTAAELARSGGFGLAIIHRTERGEQYPTFPILAKWLRALDTTVAAFFKELEAGDEIQIIPTEEKWYGLLTDILKSGQQFFIDGIHANLMAMAAATKAVPGDDLPARHHDPKATRASPQGKSRRAWSR